MSAARENTPKTEWQDRAGRSATHANCRKPNPAHAAGECAVAGVLGAACPVPQPSLGNPFVNGTVCRATNDSATGGIPTLIAGPNRGPAALRVEHIPAAREGFSSENGFAGTPPPANRNAGDPSRCVLPALSLYGGAVLSSGVTHERDAITETPERGERMLSVRGKVITGRQSARERATVTGNAGIPCAPAAVPAMKQHPTSPAMELPACSRQPVRASVSNDVPVDARTFAAALDRINRMPVRLSDASAAANDCAVVGCIPSVSRGRLITPDNFSYRALS